MADQINTLDPQCTTLPQPVKGDGFSLTHDPDTGKWRADVWGEAQRCVPFVGEMNAQRIPGIAARLLSDFEGMPVGYKAAVNFQAALVAAYG